MADVDINALSQSGSKKTFGTTSTQDATEIIEVIEEKQSGIKDEGHFVVLFIGVDDIPGDSGHYFLRAYLSNEHDINGESSHDSKCYGKPVHTPTRSYNKTIIWNSFRDFWDKPPPC